MKNPSSLVIVGLCGLLASNASGGSTASNSQQPTPSAALPLASTVSAKPASDPSAMTSRKKEPAVSRSDATESLPPRLAASQAAEEAKRAHISRKPELVKTPPPPPRTERKPAAPANGYVWVPGHWRPVKGEWHWISGKWDIPATRISVWIEPRYNAKSKEWSAGYWQPDREQPYEAESVVIDQSNRVKF